ncbi:MAG: GntR family transcriptional regulator [Acidimicrobiales bacterium]
MTPSGVEDWVPIVPVDPMLPGEHRTLAEKAFTSLHNLILNGDLKAGERLPIEDIAEKLGMSPMPVREAVRRLDLLGLVENIPHKGARVTELSLDDLLEVYELRLLLEPLAIHHAARNFTEADANQARAALEAMDKARPGSPESWRYHRNLHIGLYRAAGSLWLSRLIQPLWESSERYRIAIPVKSKPRELRSEHEAVLEACIAGDASQAAARLYHHLATTANALAKVMGSRELFPLTQGGTWEPPVLTRS